ncbi:MAG: enoyl-CoA hydratase-related protein [Acidimicrobiia bacterium]|nr:enoyl-CoA hydratase-related protein [Acidimicrobiia bacterium]
MSEPTRYEVERGVATITLDSPERRNAFSQALLVGLMGGLRQAIGDDAVRVIVVTNSGTTFSAGADLKEDRASLGPDAITFVDVVHAIDACPKPVVARVAGHAAGGGAALVVACDLAIAAESARLGITEVRIGIPPSGVAALLAHRMSRRALYESFLVGDMMPAARACELGMVNLVVPDDELDATVARYVDGLVRGAPRSLAATKKLLDAMGQLTPDQAAHLADEASRGAFQSSEAREGVAAFLEKRPANWIPTD